MIDRSLVLIDKITAAFDLDIQLSGNLNERQIYAISCQKTSGFLKRFVPDIDVSGPDREKRAWDLFTNINARCLETDKRFTELASLINSQDGIPDYGAIQDLGINPLVADVLVSARASLSAVSQNPPKCIDIFEGLTPGPGASANDGECEDTSWFTKFFESTRCASTPGLQRYVTFLLNSHPTWSAAEKQRMAWCCMMDAVPFLTNQLSEFFTVPKNALIDRGCMKEPGDNMLCQQATGQVLERWLNRLFGLDIRVQSEINRRLAQLGSSQRDTSFDFCTVDGKSCSDTITPSPVKFLLGEGWSSWFGSIRSPVCTYKGENLTLNMISTMGNGFTFPLQTLIFTSLIHGVYNTLGLALNDLRLISRSGSPRRWGVFGDDMIVEEAAYSLLIETLTAIGIIVNHDKSFSGQNPFRESCGADYWQGYNVRPVFCTSLKTVQDRLSFLNRFMLWGHTHGIYLRNVAKVLLGSIPRRFRYPIPGWESVESGIIVPLPMAFTFDEKPVLASSNLGMYKKRYMEGGGLNVPGTDTYVPTMPIVLFEPVPCQIEGYFYRRFAPKSRQVRKLRFILTNLPEGLEKQIDSQFLLGVLSSTVGENGKVTIRSDVTRYRSAFGYTPSWCVLPPIRYKGKPFSDFDVVTPWTPVEKRYSDTVERNFERYLCVVYYALL